MDKPNVPILPSYVENIGLSLNARAPKIGQFVSNPASTTNVQLQKGNGISKFKKSTPIKVI